MPIINCLETSAVARLILQGASTCLADLRDLLHTQHLASAGSGVSPAVLRRTPCKPSGAKRLRAQCEVRQVPHGQSCLCSSRNKPRLRSAPISHHTAWHFALPQVPYGSLPCHIMLLCMPHLPSQRPTCLSKATPSAGRTTAAQCSCGPTLLCAAHCHVVALVGVERLMGQTGSLHDRPKTVFQFSATYEAPWHTTSAVMQEVSQKCFPADAGRKPRLLHGARHMQSCCSSLPARACWGTGRYMLPMCPSRLHGSCGPSL